MDAVPHRPSEQEIDRHTSLLLLGTKAVGRLVLSGDEPFVAPVNFVVVDDRIVFRCEPSSHAARNVGTAVAFEVDSVDVRHEAGWSVIARGTLQDPTDRLQGDPNTERLHPWAPGDKSRWLGIHQGDVTGRWVEGPLRPSSHHDGRGYL